ncbi:bestrophin [Moraxella caviae]|uniref:Bestrophin n=1 Tax=Moraxella caviae TaxID=34060 RepID=A0A1S9ZZW7_9GAMM|nr:bestrophin family ion channel [Moraxella caviae]OOR88501.1 bestrophin [Moraxella caviae]STZ14909.1 Predicted membrane protein [Moraxella caviae]VEW11411.1 Predicted membrane protein [Moraxella caviae]
MIVRDKSNGLKLLFVWRGTILPKVLPIVLLLMAISTGVWALMHFVDIHINSVPAMGFAIFGVILSIFLGFRNTACYDRWWEGRKLWGALIANTRHFTRDTHFLPAHEREVLLVDMLMFVSLLRDRLRKQPCQAVQFSYYRTPTNDEITKLNAHINAPQFVLERIQKRLIGAYKQGMISDIIYTSIQSHIVEMGNIQAGCDRIASTPLPFPYSVLLHRAVFGFCWLLPFSLQSVMGLWTPLLVGFLSYLLLGLDELSYELEEPFGLSDNDLPLDTIVRMIERETLALMDKPMPPELVANEYYNCT